MQFQHIMGHESPATTALYGEVKASDLRDAMAKAFAWHSKRYVDDWAKEEKAEERA